MSQTVILGRDEVGLVAENEHGRVYLTECCLASAKGCADYIGCRACYAPIDDALGGVPDKDMAVVDGAWTFVDRPLALIETFGDGIPLDEYVAARPALAARKAAQRAERERLTETFRTT